MNNFGTEINLKNVSLAVYYVYSIYENSRKYGYMALQFELIETGEIAQNMQLTATASNILACDIGGFNKAQTEKFF